MAASVQFRPQNRDLGMVMREVDQDLAIFLGMRNGEKQRERDDHFLVEASNQFNYSQGEELKPDGLLTSNDMERDDVHIAADDNFLDLETDKTDYNWLLSQPETSLLPWIEVGVQDSLPTQTDISSGEQVSPKPELAKSNQESASPSNSSLQPAASTGVDSSASASAAKKKPLSSKERKPTSRSGTPAARPSLPTKPKTSRPSTPTSKTPLPSSKPMDTQPRSSTPSKTRSRSSTPASRPSVTPVGSNPPSRSATPTRKPVAPPTTANSSTKKTSSTTTRNPVPSRGISPVVKSRPSKPSEMLSMSQDAPQNPKASVPKRPSSASRGRPNAPAAQLSSANGKPRQKSCSPARIRAPVSSAHKTGSMMLSRSRGHSNGGDEVNPVLMGTKMVERVVNMRKLAPPKQDEYLSHDEPKKSSRETASGFGRSLSKKSLDMAIRHMDIRRSIPDNLRPIATHTSLAKSCMIGASSASSSTDCSSDSSISIDNRYLNGSV